MEATFVSKDELPPAIEGTLTLHLMSWGRVTIAYPPPEDAERWLARHGRQCNIVLRDDGGTNLEFAKDPKPVKTL